MFPKLISIGNFTVPTYGVLVVSGILVGIYVTGRLSEREGTSRDEIYNLGIYLAFAGIIGSKLTLIFQQREDYYRNPRELFSFATLQSGGVYYGGLILATLVGIWYTRRRQIPFLKTADAFAPGIAIGHAIGRLGCFSAGCCWGLPTSLPWAVTFTNPYSNEIVGVPLNTPIHPTQLYESLAEFLIFLFLYSQFRKKQFDGQMLAWYFVLYGTVRFLVEFLRSHVGEAVLFGGAISVAQVISLGLIIIGAWLLWLRPQRREQAAPARP